MYHEVITGNRVKIAFKLIRSNAFVSQSVKDCILSLHFMWIILDCIRGLVLNSILYIIYILIDSNLKQ